MGKKMTSDEIKAHLTLEEIERIGSDREQMTYATTQFIESLVKERIHKAALLAACVNLAAQIKATVDPKDWETVSTENTGIVKALAAIDQAGEGV